MSEKSFVVSIQKSVSKEYPGSFVWKTNDRFSLGMPDLIIIIDGTLYAVEAKAMSLHCSKDKVLSHPFSPVQISVLKQIEKAGGVSMGAIFVPSGGALIVRTDQFNKDGNFTSEELLGLKKVRKRNGTWRITEWVS